MSCSGSHLPRVLRCEPRAQSLFRVLFAARRLEQRKQRSQASVGTIRTRRQKRGGNLKPVLGHDEHDMVAPHVPFNLKVVISEGQSLLVDNDEPASQWQTSAP